jgi:hypothetical protein
MTTAQPTITYNAWHETKLVPSKVLTGSMAQNYEESLIATHAVEVVDGVPAAETVCRKSVRGELSGSFDRTMIVTRCAACAEPIGEAHLGR